MIRPIASLVAMLLGVVMLTGCSEQPQVSQFVAGNHPGQADTRPWESSAFNGDRAAWEKQMRERARNQSEYNRIVH